MEINVINFKEKADLIEELHSYKLIAQMNECQFKLVKAKREFIWHQHPETDEVFIVIKGTMQIDLRDTTLHLAEGEMVVVPKGVEHKPVCRELCCILLIEPEGTINTGNTGGTLTDTSLEKI